MRFRKFLPFWYESLIAHVTPNIRLLMKVGVLKAFTYIISFLDSVTMSCPIPNLVLSRGIRHGTTCDLAVYGILRISGFGRIERIPACHLVASRGIPRPPVASREDFVLGSSRTKPDRRRGRPGELEGHQTSTGHNPWKFEGVLARSRWNHREIEAARGSRSKCS